MPNTFALIHEDGGVYGISFPDFPGAISTARRIDDVVRKGAEMLNFHVAGMVEDGDPIPVPRSLEELRADPEFRKAAKGAVVAMVTYELPGKAVRLNISMDEHLLQAIDEAAKAAGQSRSAFLAEAARQRVRAQ